MKKQAILALATSLAAMAPLSATAGDGLYLSGSIKNTTLAHTINRNTGSNTSPSITTRAEETDFAGGVGLGYITHGSGSMFYGAELFYNAENAATANLNNLLKTEVSLNSTTGIKLIGGFDVNERFSLFGFVGSTEVDFDLNNSYPFAPPKRNASGSESAVTYGFGLSYDISDRLSLVSELTQINDVSFAPIPEVAVPGKINDNELDLNSWSVGLRYSF